MFADQINPGLALISQLQLLSPGLDIPMLAVTWLGSLEFYLVLLPFIYWTLDPALAARTFCVLLCNDFISTTGKMLWHGPRPYWTPGDTGVRGMAAEASYGVPSGHAGGSMVTWGYLATQVRSPVFRVIAVALILLIGFSRPYLAVHFPHDVVVGWLIGGAVLLLALRVQAPLGAWLAGLPGPRYVAVAAALALAVMAWGLTLPGLVAASPDPADWARYATTARSPSHFFALAGTLFGLMLGYRRQQTLIAYQPPREWSHRLTCFVFGMIVMLAIYLGLGVVTHALTAPETLAAYGLRFFRFAAVAWWVTELAPRCFLKSALAGRR